MTTSCFQAFKRSLRPHVPLFPDAGCLFSLYTAVSLFSSLAAWRLLQPLDFFVSPTLPTNRVSLWLTRRGSLQHKDLGITMMSSSKLSTLSAVCSVFRKVEGLSEEESAYRTKISRVEQGLEGEVANPLGRIRPSLEFGHHILNWENKPRVQVDQLIPPFLPTRPRRSELHV